MERFFGAISDLASNLATIICAVLILATSFSVVIYHRGIAVSWLDDLLRMLLIWLVFLGSVAPVWNRDHITMDALYLRYGPTARRIVDLFVCVLGAIVCGFITWVSISTTTREYEFGALLPSGEIPAWLQTFSLPVSFGLMTLCYIGVLVRTLAGRPAPTHQAQ